jgi:hypothetical protein
MASVTGIFLVGVLMPGKVHVHNGKRVYHRRDGALTFHGRRHSRYTPSLDRKRKAKTVLSAKKHKKYPHAGDSPKSRV